MEKKERLFIVFNQQRWDEVRLIKGFWDKEDAEKLQKSLKLKEDRYEEIYCLEDIEIENSKEDKIKINKEELLMIASFHNFQARESATKEGLRFKKVSEIINKYIDHEELYKFQDNREDQFLNEKSKLKQKRDIVIRDESETLTEEGIKIREIGKEISNKFSFGEIYRALKGINNEPKILSFIFENYKGFLNDIDYIIVVAYKLSKEKNKKGNIKERK